MKLAKSLSGGFQSVVFFVRVIQQLTTSKVMYSII